MNTINQTIAKAFKAIMLLLIHSFFFPAFAQQSYTYLFSTTPFISNPAGGPKLDTIGNTVTPVTVLIPSTTCPDHPTIDLTYFQLNSGFKAKAFFSGTYSIEMIFKFDELNGYNRIIDFSNSLSDNGIYTLGDCLNFYPTGNIGPCPGTFDTINYRQIAITRDDSTKEMNIYVNGVLFTTHLDVTDYYVIGAAPNDSIKFFNDDLVVPNEASPGYIALIRMCDFILLPQAVLASYTIFCGSIIGIPDADHTVGLIIYPNPAKDQFTLQFSNVDFSKKIIYTLTNTVGQRIMQIPVYDELTSIETKNISAGVYFYELTSGNGILKTGKIVLH